jgi:hypothetical protein
MKRWCKAFIVQHVTRTSEAVSFYFRQQISLPSSWGGQWHYPIHTETDVRQELYSSAQACNYLHI